MGFKAEPEVSAVDADINAMRVLTCFVCDVEGHFQAECPLLHRVLEGLERDGDLPKGASAQIKARRGARGGSRGRGGRGRGRPKEAGNAPPPQKKGKVNAVGDESDSD